MIYCRYCGAQNVDYGVFCSSCGKPLKIAPAKTEESFPDSRSTPGEKDAAAPHISPGARFAGERPSIKNYLVESIIVTVCCCWALGVPAIIFAAQVNSKIAMGDFIAAEKASNYARIFCIVSFIIGLVGNIAYMLIYGAAFIAEMSGILN